MSDASGKHVVVVDGSNLATEGRTTPSLRQLDEAVRAYALEDPDAEIVVVVDASFEHRIDSAERQQLIDAELHGEIVSPPAGAIGRGDAFVLRIAERTGARVLSNDSFQEFHAEHPWLFDTGRLVGGKPVTGVGWIFTPRVPVRGPKSRQADGKAKRKAAEVLSPPVKAAELAKAAKKIAARKSSPAALPDGSKPKVGDVWAPAARAGERTAAHAAKKRTKSGAPEDSGPKGAKAKVEKVKPAEKPAKQKSAKAAPDVGAAEGPKKGARKAVAAANAAVPNKKVAKEVSAPSGAKKSAKKAVPADTKATERGAPVAAAETADPSGKRAAAKNASAKNAGAKKAAAKKAAAAPAEVAAEEAPTKKSAAKKSAAAKAARAPTGANGTTPSESSRRTAAKNPAVREAIGHALAEAIAPPSGVSEDGKAGRGDEKRKKQDGKEGRHRRRRSAAPPPAVNEPFAFITFVATYPLDSELQGEVVSFTSHGAMVDVDLPDGGVLHSYIPLTAMGDPPPTKAREVLTRGERRSFVLVALDPPRRVAELALPQVSTAHGRSGR